MKVCEPSAAVYQAGRGSEPIMEVGSITLADALNILLSPCGAAVQAMRLNCNYLQSWCLAARKAIAENFQRALH
jgi:hypothetical protein